MSDPPISTWTKFRSSVSEPLKPSLFESLIAEETDFVDAFYGRVEESPGQCLLVVVWKSAEAYDTFRKSFRYEELLSSLRKQSATEPETFVVDFGRVAFWWRFGPNTEIRTVYFPSSLSPQARKAAGDLRGLVLNMGLGINGRLGNRAPYRGVPTCGWVDGTTTWNGKDALACLWCHYWASKEAEKNFKTTERRVPKDGESHRPLASEAFGQDLTDLGAVGWEEYHVDFEKVAKAKIVGSN
ncbi:hypothetical protein CDD83_11012 [Cordyceps sp. RAO-2017]|nr:hypothetical protein CDD83_11012 [Cordyceps sp. RAO-2017]